MKKQGEPSPVRPVIAVVLLCVRRSVPPTFAARLPGTSSGVKVVRHDAEESLTRRHRDGREPWRAERRRWLLRTRGIRAVRRGVCPFCSASQSVLRGWWMELRTEGVGLSGGRGGFGHRNQRVEVPAAADECEQDPHRLTVLIRNLLITSWPRLADRERYRREGQAMRQNWSSQLMPQCHQGDPCTCGKFRNR
jgi:hypothetical protein